MVTRLDLDGTYSPIGLVGKILKAEPNLKIPVPIEDLALQLDIAEIKTLTTEGFEGGLVTDETRSVGGILVKAGVSRQRRRFTIGHELCHFLIPFHKPPKTGQFLCDRAGMRSWDVKSKNSSKKMEAEANRFASLILMPPPQLRQLIDAKRYASLTTVLEIHQHFDVSKEAAARAFVEYNPETIAIIIARDGKFVRAYKNIQFPWIILNTGDPIPAISLLHSYRDRGHASDSDSTDSEYWVDTYGGRQVSAMYEQILLQSNGFAMIQLKVLQPDEDMYDADADLTAKQRYQKSQARWRR